MTLLVMIYYNYYYYFKSNLPFTKKVAIGPGIKVTKIVYDTKTIIGYISIIISLDKFRFIL